MVLGLVGCVVGGLEPAPMVGRWGSVESRLFHNLGGLGCQGFEEQCHPQG